MLRPRLIPCLLVDSGALVKTVRFADPKYVGDPINAVRIFNEKEVDELMVLDISATRDGREPDYGLIRRIAAECRMPLCYGGGVGRAAQFEKIVGLGVEKVAVSSAAIADPSLIASAARRVGTQSVVAVMDVRRRKPATGCPRSEVRGPKSEAPERHRTSDIGHRTTHTRCWDVYIRNGTVAASIDALACARVFEQHGAGEIVVNSIDNDGAMTGYDLDLAGEVRQATKVPMTVLGGAGSLEDVAKLFRRVGTVGAAAGSLFVFKGRFRAVLISYPRRAEKDALLAPFEKPVPDWS